MATKTRNDLRVGDFVLYETDDSLFKEAIISEILSDDEVSIVFTVKGIQTKHGLPRVNAEWCVKHTPEVETV